MYLHTSCHIVQKISIIIGRLDTNNKGFVRPSWFANSKINSLKTHVILPFYSRFFNVVLSRFILQRASVSRYVALGRKPCFNSLLEDFANLLLLYVRVLYACIQAASHKPPNEKHYTHWVPGQKLPDFDSNTSIQKPLKSL